ncbi:MAG: hypothetical protein OEZ23_01450, partial [Gammaproteobacteria bacterium]|nr:hypothetical protein [Gammaproteobacteria bacterium]
VYGPSNLATATLTTSGPNPLSKEIIGSTDVTIGDTFSYRITIPATPMATALNDVRVLDDLTISAADLSFVSVTKVSGSQPWTPVNSGTSTSLIIEDTTTGIDIPAGEQAVIEISVVLKNTVTNADGRLFSNTASYTFNQVDNDDSTQLAGGGATSADRTIVEPLDVTLQKTGPALMRIGVPETFTLDIQNNGNSTAWDMVIADRVPNAAPGGLCDVPPSGFTAQLFEADGVTPVSSALVEGTDYVTSFVASPDCTLAITMQSAAAALAPTQRLMISYTLTLDEDSPPDTAFTNVAAVTDWYSGDTDGTGATGDIRAYSRTLSDGTSGVVDHEDDHTVVSEQIVLIFHKTVTNVSTGQSPGTDAVPGDTLRYDITITNLGNSALDSFDLVDELDGLSTSERWFAPGSLSNIVVSAVGADTSNSDPNGGVNGTGLLDIRGLSLDAPGGANDTLTVEFEATLAPVITSGTSVLNQTQVAVPFYGLISSDDPNIGGADDPFVVGDEDPTATLITSSPKLIVSKSSEDITDDPAILLAGETLRYTLTVKNIGSENAVNVILSDTIPNFTTYVAGSTSLNDVAVSDPATGVSALEAGMLINSPRDLTPGFMPADSSAATDNVATIVFDVRVNNDTFDGTLISNQGFVKGDGAGSGIFATVPSDDPDTPAIDDPVINLVGDIPLIDSQKTVEIIIDMGTPGFVDPGDTLRYTITTTNQGTRAATGVILTDAVPANTTYVADSVYLNGLAVGQPDSGASPLATGIPISSDDLTPPVPLSGTLSVGGSSIVVFDVQVNAGVASGTIISNQGSVASNETFTELTDWDGDDLNGDQPTEVVVGDGQQLSVTKAVSVVGGGPLEAGDTLEYRITLRNISSVAATDVLITDDLDLPIAGQLSYVAGSAQLDGSAAGINFSGSSLTADYAAAYGDLLPGETTELIFQAVTSSALPIGTTVTNTALASWNLATQSAGATVSIDIGGIPGVASFNGEIWHDSDFDGQSDSGETPQAGWIVEIYLNNSLFETVTTDLNGLYTVNGLAPNSGTGDTYAVRFRHPNAAASTASLGTTVSSFTNDWQQITDILLGSGSNVQGLNLPLQPNGVVYNSVLRTPVPGVTLTMLNSSSGLVLPASCFNDPVQQNQVTLANGYYKFDLNFSQPDCPSGADYLIQVVEPASGFTASPSVINPPATDVSTSAFSVPACPGSTFDAILATADHCEVQGQAGAPPLSVPVRTTGTLYYLHMTLSSGLAPVEDQLFNNHIPVDPELGSAVAVSKTSPLVNVTRGQLVPYTITLNNTLPVPLAFINLVDTFPAGFKYVEGSTRLDGAALEPLVAGQQLIWPDMVLNPDTRLTLKLLLVVSSGVKEGEYVNRVQAINGLTSGEASNIATATVRVVPDPDFDCSDVIGKVFDDTNLNGYQDEGENGIAGVQLVTARGLQINTDEFGRFHLTCALVPDMDRGSNFIMKLNTRSLPSGYRLTTENPRVQRATRGKMMKFNFGASISRVVGLELADGVFEKDSDEIRPQWMSRFDLLLNQLRKEPSVLRITYLADLESMGLVEDRLSVVREEIEERWKVLDCCYQLRIETEVFKRQR